MTRRSLSLCFVVLLVVAGCSGGDKWTKNLPDTVRASGIVLLDGQPLDGATLVFAPLPPGQHAANAITASDGTFFLEAFPSKSGAVPGKYQVGVMKTESVKTDAPAKKPDLGEDEAHADRNGPEGVSWKSAIPADYENPATSGLTATIPTDGTKSLKIELKSAK